MREIYGERVLPLSPRRTYPWLTELLLQVAGQRAAGSSSIPESGRLSRDAEKLAHARGAEQAMPPGLTLDWVGRLAERERPGDSDAHQVEWGAVVHDLDHPAPPLRTGHARFQASGSPFTCFLKNPLSGSVPLWSCWWQVRHRTNVFLLRAAIICCQKAFPLATSFIFRMWWISNGPVVVSQYSHCFLFIRLITSERLIVHMKILGDTSSRGSFGNGFLRSLRRKILMERVFFSPGTVRT